MCRENIIPIVSAILLSENGQASIDLVSREVGRGHDRGAGTRRLTAVRVGCRRPSAPTQMRLDEGADGFRGFIFSSTTANPIIKSPAMHTVAPPISTFTNNKRIPGPIMAQAARRTRIVVQDAFSEAPRRTDRSSPHARH